MTEAASSSYAIEATVPEIDTRAREKESGGLEPLLRPRSVAVIGASRERGSIGAEIFHNLIANGFQGPVDRKSVV